MKKLWVKTILKQIRNVEKTLYWYEKFGYNFYYYYIKLRDFFTRKQTLVHFVYETNTQCTLKCKQCHSYMPYFKPENHYMTTFESFKKEIDKLLNSVDLILSFRLQGGETLLVKDLAKIVDYACSKKQIQHIQIISNGTIIPSEELLNSMKNPKVLLSLSDYSVNEKLKNRLKYKEILDLCSQNNINAKHWLIKAGDMWVARNSISNNFDIKDDQLAKENLASCWCFAYPKCIIMFHGKLYICAPAVYYAANQPDFKIPEDEIIDVMNTKTNILTKKIKKLAYKRIFNLCARCNAALGVNIRQAPAEQLEN